MVVKIQVTFLLYNWKIFCSRKLKCYRNNNGSLVLPFLAMFFKNEINVLFFITNLIASKELEY